MNQEQNHLLPAGGNRRAGEGAAGGGGGEGGAEGEGDGGAKATGVLLLHPRGVHLPGDSRGHQGLHQHPRQPQEEDQAGEGAGAGVCRHLITSSPFKWTPVTHSLTIFFRL